MVVTHPADRHRKNKDLSLKNYYNALRGKLLTRFKQLAMKPTSSNSSVFTFSHNNILSTDKFKVIDYRKRFYFEFQS